MSLCLRVKLLVAFFFIVAVVLISAPTRADKVPGDRVQVICPSTPEVDSYSPITIVARTDDWKINPGFTGHVWLWTDGPWFRPFHVEFRPSDRGVIVMPGRFGALVLQRVEAFTLGGSVQTWSNPVIPAAPRAEGPRLLWGTIGENEPGVDFVLGKGPDPHPANDKNNWAQPLKTVTVIPMVTRKFRKETWYLSPNPALPDSERETLTREISGADGNSQLLKVIADHDKDLLVVRQDLDPHDVVPLSEFLLAVGPGPSGPWAGSVDRPVKGVVAAPGGLIAVWSMGPDPARIWKALKQGAAYGAWGSRIIIDLSAPSGSSPGFHALIAGEGPRETVAITRLRAGKSEPVFSRSTDSDHLEFDFHDPKPGPGARYVIEVLEPGSPRGGRAVWASAAGME